MKITYIITSIVLLFSIGTSQGQCFFTSLNVSVGSCDGVSGTYKVMGDIDFINAPSGGTLNIEVNNGVTIYDTIINPIFSSPQTWSISSIPSDGTSISVTAYFSSVPTCSISLNSNAPVNCTCIADAGTFNASVVGDGINNYVLCFGDQIDLSSNMDYISPADQSVVGVNYDPGIAYMVYSCLPTIFPTTPLYDNFGAPNDSCLIGLISFGDNFSDVNTMGAPPNFGFPYENNTIYYVPITMYSVNDGIYAVSNNGGPYCYDAGATVAVTYLPEITAIEVVDSLDGSVTVTLTGGYLELFNGGYSVANNAAGVLSSATVDSSGGSFEITGLAGGSLWNYTVIDDNGCSVDGDGIMGGTVGVNENVFSYSLHPNPSSDFLELYFLLPFQGNITVFDKAGKEILTRKVVGESVILDIQNLDSGVYIIKAESEGNIFLNKRFIKID